MSRRNLGPIFPGQGPHDVIIFKHTLRKTSFQGWVSKKCVQNCCLQIFKFCEAGLGCPWVYTKAKAHIILLVLLWYTWSQKTYKSAAPRVKLELRETLTAKKNAPATVVAGLKFGSWEFYETKSSKSAAPRVKLELCETLTVKKNAPATVVAGLKFGSWGFPWTNFSGKIGLSRVRLRQSQNAPATVVAGLSFLMKSGFGSSLLRYRRTSFKPLLMSYKAKCAGYCGSWLISGSLEASCF